MDTTDSGIVFDQDGICDHCLTFKRDLLPSQDTGEKGSAELDKLAKKIKADGIGKEFDCLIGMSGGLDSCYLLHVVVKHLRLRPLLFHVNGGWNSAIAVNNINVMVTKLGLDLYTEVINWEEMKDFQLSYFKAGIPSIDVPQGHAFIATLYNYADKHQQKYILNHGNYSAEIKSHFLNWGLGFLGSLDLRS